MKVIVSLICIVLFYLVIGNVSALVIPEEALRIRVIPNSNDNEDVAIKNIVKDHLQDVIYELLKEIEDVKEAQTIINDNLDLFQEEIKEIFNVNNYNYTFDINYGQNYFPHKEYKGITYEEGFYESLVITIGEGLGDNWWCVMYPPLCLVEENQTDVDYTTYINELIEKYL